MKFEQALIQFMYEIEKEYNLKPHDCITKLGLSYEFYNLVMRETFEKIPYARSSFADLNEPRLYNIPIVPRHKEKF